MTATRMVMSYEFVVRSLKLFFAISLLITCYLILATNSAFAQTASSSSQLQPITYTQQPSYFSPQSPHTASLAIYNFSHAVSCILIGQSPIAPCLEYRVYKDAQGMVRSVPYLSSVNTNNGVLGMTLSMVGEVISTPPIRSSEFFANLGEQIGIKSANAQVGGSGSGVLAPIFKLWEVSRNIAYLAMIVIFVVVGFAVMFRQKLNPQTVVTIQMALPGLVIGLVMITFSYFVASLISDVAFVGTNVVGYYFSLAQGPGVTPTGLPLISKPADPGKPLNPRQGQEENMLTIFSRFTNVINWDNTYNALNGIWPLLKNPYAQFTDRGQPRWIPQLDAQRSLVLLSMMLTTQFVLPIAGLGGGWWQTLGATGAIAVNVNDPTFIASWTLAFIAMIILIYSMFRLLLRLIQSFLYIIFLTIASPFYFLVTSLPGRQGLIPNWFFNMLCNVLAFPAIFAVFYFVAFILGKGDDPLFVVNEAATITGGSTFPLLGGMQLDFLRALLAFGALVASPSIPDIICRAVGRPSQLGALAAGAVGGAIAAGQRYQGQAQGGISGFAGNIGNLNETPGYEWESRSNQWIRSRNPQTGARPGRISILGANIMDPDAWWRDPLGRRRAQAGRQGAPGTANPTGTGQTE